MMTTAFFRAWFGWAMVGAALVSSSCKGVSSGDDDEGGSDDSGDSGAYCARAVGKFNACGMGPLARDLEEDCEAPVGAEERCYFECAIDASCADIREAVCTGGLTPGLEACYVDCEPPPFTCGSGETFPSYVTCDGFDDCVDGTDERGCPSFTCGSGESVPESAECDFYVDCADGSDEHAACPDVFTCANGQRIPDYFACDDYPDCADGSDEHARCPSVTCADGTTVSGARCDESLDCFDGSDEPVSCPPSPRDQVCGTP